MYDILTSKIFVILPVLLIVDNKIKLTFHLRKFYYFFKKHPLKASYFLYNWYTQFPSDYIIALKLELKLIIKLYCWIVDFILIHLNVLFKLKLFFPFYGNFIETVFLEHFRTNITKHMINCSRKKLRNISIHLSKYMKF